LAVDCRRRRICQREDYGISIHLPDRIEIDGHDLNAIRKALDVIPADKLVLSSDCGYGRQGFNRTVAFYKTTAIAQARNVVLKELGLPERYVPAADPALQTDVPKCSCCMGRYCGTTHPYH
jgi:5-methyltetrahydropteroyltriglutamate--homocysteine methyltransferase